MIRLAITAPCSTSDGAVRKYRFFGSVLASSSAGEVFAGENCTTPAPVILSMTLSDTEDEAAPTITSAFASRSLSVWAPAMSGVPSPESALTCLTGLPSTPPAALMSSMAVCTPANSGGPRKARSPVCGSSVPTVNTPSPLVGALELEPAADGELLDLLPALSLLLSLPHAVSASDAVASTTAVRHARVVRVMEPPMRRKENATAPHGSGAALH